MPRNYNKDIEKKRKDIPLTRETAGQFWHNSAAASTNKKDFNARSTYANYSDRARIADNRTSMRKATVSKVARQNNRVVMRKQTASKKK